ncbi:MAG: PEP-CTERM sorting domain-containing protein [Gemmatimonadota bacterium]
MPKPFPSASRLAAALLLLAAGTLNAQTIVYDNGAPSGAQGAFIRGAGAWGASDFTLLTSATINTVRIWDLRSTPDAGSVTWSILANNGGALGSALFGGVASVTGVATGTCCNGYVTNEDEFSVGAISLAAGTYWLQLSDATNSFAYYWETATPSGSSSYQDRQWTQPDRFGGGESASQNENAFQLLSNTTEDATPEPASVILMATGLLVVGAARFRRRLPSASRQ